MRIAALVLLGAICLTRLPIDLLPKVSLPVVAINTQWPNVAPEEMEAQITRPIEQAVSSVPNLYQVTSNSSQGSSSVRVTFNWGTDVGQAAVDVLQLVERAKRDFPTDPTLQNPVVFKFDPSSFPILIYGVSGEKDLVKLRTLLRNYVSPLLESAEGVAAATVSGGLERAVVVDIDPERLRAHHLSLSQVINRIKQENLNLPAGMARQGGTEYTIRSLGWFGDISELAAVPVGRMNGQVVPLSAVADVRDSHPEARMFTRLNGEPAVGIVITKQTEGNTVDAARSVEERLAQAKKLYPHLNFGLAYNQAQFIEGSMHELTEAAIIGGILAVLILLFFLRNYRSTLVVALSIPTSIISTFALLYMCGFTLNTMSLGGLALATGLIVDDAVVVLENIFRHIERDRKRAPEAAVTGTQEIMSAVVASTFTVVVVFLPLLLIRGQAGQMFAQFALVVMFSILVSLLDAATVVPMLASRLIKGEAHHELSARESDLTGSEKMFKKSARVLDALDNSYRNGLTWALAHRRTVLVGAVGVSLLSFLLIPQIGTELMPEADSGDFRVRVKMPIGTALSKTDETMRQIERILLADPDVETVFSAAGTNLSIRGTTTSLSPNEGSASVKLKKNRSRTTMQTISDLRRKLAAVPGAKSMPSQVDIVSNIISGGQQNVEVNIFGDDLATLAATSRQVISKVRNIPGLENVDVNWQEAMPEVQWKVDRQKALQLGLSFADIAGTVNTATNGTIASYYQEQGFQYPILVQLPEDRRKTVEQLMDLNIQPSADPAAPPIGLGQVATPTMGMGPSEITRLDRQRYISVQGVPQGRSPGEIQADVARVMEGVEMPLGYRWDWGTSQKRRAEEFSGMGLAVLLAVCLIYMLLAAQFESFIHPLTVLMSVPLSAIGVVLALFLTDRAFGLTAFIGLLMLVGIVVKNGILLVDYTNVLRSRGIPRDQAVLTAGPTRLRPILMTALAASLGMLPIAIGIGSASRINAPMATAVVGGLFTSTILTLFVVPCVYTLFDDIGRRLSRQDRDLHAAHLVEPSVDSVAGDEQVEPDAATEPAAEDKV